MRSAMMCALGVTSAASTSGCGAADLGESAGFGPSAPNDDGGSGGAGGDDGAASFGDMGGTGGGGTGGGSGVPQPPPEEEREADFRVPRASGPFVYSASETSDSVAVIDSARLTIEVVGVGRGPTVVAPVDTGDPQTGRVVVLDQRSDDLAVLTTPSIGETTVAVYDVTPGANNLVTTPDGRYAFAHVDVDGPEEVGAGSDQEISILDLREREVHLLTVGAHPRGIEFSPDSRFAYVITADGVNVVALADVATIGKPDIVPVYVDLGVDPNRLEVRVAAEHGVALARVDGEARLVATDLHTGDQQVFELDATPTDLDVAPSGDYALLTLPTVEQGSSLLELALPLTSGATLVEHRIPGEYVGQSQLSTDGATAILFTTVNPPRPLDAGDDTETEASTGGDPDALPDDVDPRLRVTLGRRGDSGWSTDVTFFVDRPVETAGVAPDGANGVLVHAMSSQGVPFAYTLLDLLKDVPIKKTQTTLARPEPILFTPEGDRAVVLLRNDATGVRRAEQVDLRSFIVEGLELGSPPEGAGFVEATSRVFVSQDHPTGRITFIDADGSIETVTGYRLNGAVKD